LSFKNSTLLITGGTGSFGNAALKHFIDQFKEIRIFSRDEKKQEDMRIKLNSSKIKFYIGDIRDIDSVKNAVVDCDYVFHAAALKQVPSCEFYPMQAIKTNVIGTNNLIQAIKQSDVQNAVFLSTDKAAYPINAMGMSKAMMEKIVVAESRDCSGKIISATRYGNVMASRGSVIPLFTNQLKNGQPITVTDPEMTRFMMSLDESVELVEFAFKNAAPGDLFVKKSPAATLKVLIDALQEIFSINAEVKVIGTRHGEKLYETLLTREEMQKAKDMGDFYKVSSDDRDLNYGKYFSEGKTSISNADDYHSHNSRRLDTNEMIELLLKLDFIKRTLHESK
jgi:UDP-glucose 4-epimerase